MNQDSESRGFWQAALDALTAHVAVLDGEGRILAVNAAWKRFAAANNNTGPDDCIGVNYLEVCDRAPGPENGEEGAAAGKIIRDVLAGKRKELSLSYPCHSPVRKRWFMMRVTRFEGPGPARVVIAHENITAPRAAQLRATAASKRLEAANLELRRQAAELELAEMLEADSNRVLELIAKNELVETVLQEITLLVQRQKACLRCGVIRRNKDRFELTAADSMPLEMRDRLRAAAEKLPAVGDPSLHNLAQAIAHADAIRLVPVEAQPGIIAGWLAVTTEGNEEKPEICTTIMRAASLVSIALDHTALYEKLSFQASHDALTEVPNRLWFHEKLQWTLTQAKRDGGLFGVCMLDLDRFKLVNDLYGHRYGDSLLRHVAQRVRECLRPGDIVARLGGDEFALLLDSLSGPREADQIAERVVLAVRAPYSIYGQEILITASLGSSIFPAHGAEPAILVRNADMALSKSKSRGGNVATRFEEGMGAIALERLEIERELHGAVERGEIAVHYQLQHDMNGRISGMEALARWRSPVLGLVPPGKFIPVAEETGLIAGIGNFVLRSACLKNVEWQRQGFPAVCVAVNVSTVQLISPSFADEVAKILAETGLAPALLELEITETTMMSSLQEATGLVERLGGLGVKVSIDDFGTGYSSLSYLHNLPVDAIKIDRSFVQELGGESASGAAVVRAIIALAHGLKLHVVAEGVETEEQFETLTSLECDVAQGYLFHKPMSADAVTTLLEQAAGQNCENDAVTPAREAEHIRD